jgi:hypothetical protein
MSKKMWLLLAVLVMAMCMLVVLVGCHGQFVLDDGNGNGNGDGGEGLYSAYIQGASWNYRETLDDGTQNNLTFTVTGTRNIGGVECVELRVEDGGDTLMFAYGTFSEADGGFIYALALPDRTITDQLDTPAQLLPGNPPADFTADSNLFPLNGTYQGTTVSTAATVTVPAGTYTNAWQVQLNCENPGFNGANRMTFWIVPGVGMVRIELLYPGDVAIDVELVSFTPAP